MTSTSVNNTMIPPDLLSNLNQVLLSKKGADKDDDKSHDVSQNTQLSVHSSEEHVDSSKPIVLVTNSDGVDSSGVIFLVQALVRDGLYNVHVCVPQSWVLFFFFILVYLFCFGFWWVFCLVFKVCIFGSCILCFLVLFEILRL